MNREDGQVYSVWILQFSCFTKYNRMQSKHKQTNVNIADETLTDYKILGRYHFTKSKNFLKTIWIGHWIPMFIGTPCRTSYSAIIRGVRSLKWKVVWCHFFVIFWQRDLGNFQSYLRVNWKRYLLVNPVKFVVLSLEL